MVKWPDRARIAIRKLFEPLQAIDVYVEDVDDEAFYRTLLNSATDRGVTIARVFGLGGRSEVVTAARVHDQSSRRALFIVDGDLPWVRGEPMPNLVGLHQHDAYCVENLLLCETAITTILAQEMVITDTKAREQLGFSEWCRSIVEPMTDLFAAYATVNEFDPTIPTVGNPVGNLCTHPTSPPITRLDVAKVNAACNRAIGSAQAVAAPDVVTARHSTIRARISALADPLKAVSGKDYLLPLLSFHLNSFGCRIKKRTLRVRLADTGDRARFQRLSESLVLAARGAL